MGKMFLELMVLVGVIGTASGYIRTSTFDDTATPEFLNPSWMVHIPDSRPLSQITLPGTHNTMALYGGALAACQSWSLDTQLLAGVRFLDIRVRFLGRKLKVYHSIVYQRAHFGQVLEGVAGFLRRYPSEVVLMRLKLERSNANVITTDLAVMKYFARYDDVLLRHLNVHNATLGEVRGRIIILQDFSGFEPLAWPYRTLNIADDRRVPTLGHVAEKWRSVRKHLEAAVFATEDRIFLTYASGAGFLASAKDVARQINAKLYNFLEEGGLGDAGMGLRFGIIAMDFPASPLLQIIIDFN